MRLHLVALAALWLAACGTVTPQPLSGRAADYLLQLYEMQTPDFTVYHPVGAVDAGWLVPGAGSTLQTDGLQETAQVQYWRQSLSTVSALAISNGPYVVYATVAKFSSESGADDAMKTLVAGLDSRKGALPASTGPLGNQAHAISEISDYQNVQVIQITVLWRQNNLINSIVVTGRYGGVRLDDALMLAHAQNANELGNGIPSAPAPASTATSSATQPATLNPSPAGFIP